LAYANNGDEKEMSRPVKCRKIDFLPEILIFKPAGVPARELQEVTITLDEMEAIRLADLEGLYQEDAAGHMNVSRQTFANILVSAHQKIAESLMFGKALRIEGGRIEMKERTFVCQVCGNTWGLPFGAGSPAQCPQCQGSDIHRTSSGQGWGRCCRQRKGCCRKNIKETNA
jgi:uncharacterized protein